MKGLFVQLVELLQQVGEIDLSDTLYIISIM